MSLPDLIGQSSSLFLDSPVKPENDEHCFFVSSILIPCSLRYGEYSSMTKGLWPTDILKSKEIQDALRKKVKIAPLKGTPLYIAAVDASYIDEKIAAVATLYKYPELKHL